MNEKLICLGNASTIYRKMQMIQYRYVTFLGMVDEI